MFETIIILLLLQRVDVGLTISPNAIAHFSYCKCDPYPNDCCIGSFILPYIIITSAYCAENCKVVILGNTTNVTIKRFYKHSYNRNYVWTGSRNIINRNDVALVHVIDDPKTERPHLKLSALQTEVLGGRTGFFPVFDNLRLKLMRTIVEQCCKGTSMMGYVLCTANKSLNLSNAYHHQQGIPLLIEGKIVGLSGFMDKSMCINEQRYFMAIEPAVLWIRSVIRNLSRQKENKNKNNTQVAFLVKKPSVLEAINKNKYNDTATKNIFLNSQRANIIKPPPEAHNRSQEATTTVVIPKTETLVNEDQDNTTYTEFIEQQAANNLLEAINLSQMESRNLSDESESVEVTSSTFSSSNVLDFLSQIGYRPDSDKYFGYSYRKSFQNVSSQVT